MLQACNTFTTNFYGSYFMTTQFLEKLTFLYFQFAELFDKIDVTKEGYVDWDKFASHMLLEFYEKDDRVKSTQVPQWKDLRTLPRCDIHVQAFLFCFLKVTTLWKRLKTTFTILFMSYLL